MSIPVNGKKSHAPSRSAKLVEARSPRMRRTGGRRSVALRLHRAATFDPLRSCRRTLFFTVRDFRIAPNTQAQKVLLAQRMSGDV